MFAANTLIIDYLLWGNIDNLPECMVPASTLATVLTEISDLTVIWLRQATKLTAWQSGEYHKDLKAL